MSTGYYDLENACVVSTDFRTVSVPKEYQIAGVSGDGNSNTITFKIPSTYRGIDLLYEDFVCGVAFVNAVGNFGKTNMTFIRIDDSDEMPYNIYTWVVPPEALIEQGVLTFSLYFYTSKEEERQDDDGNTTSVNVPDIMWKTAVTTLTVPYAIDPYNEIETRIPTSRDIVENILNDFLSGFTPQASWFISKVNEFDGDLVSLDRRLTSVEEAGVPSGGSGSIVTVDPKTSEGFKIADIFVNGRKSELFAPDVSDIRVDLSNVVSNMNTIMKAPMTSVTISGGADADVNAFSFNIQGGCPVIIFGIKADNTGVIMGFCGILEAWSYRDANIHYLSSYVKSGYYLPYIHKSGSNVSVQCKNTNMTGSIQFLVIGAFNIQTTKV